MTTMNALPRYQHQLNLERVTSNQMKQDYNKFDIKYTPNYNLLIKP